MNKIFWPWNIFIIHFCRQSCHHQKYFKKVPYHILPLFDIQIGQSLVKLPKMRVFILEGKRLGSLANSIQSWPVKTWLLDWRFSVEDILVAIFMALVFTYLGFFSLWFCCTSFYFSVVDFAWNKNIWNSYRISKSDFDIILSCHTYLCRKCYARWAKDR